MHQTCFIHTFLLATQNIKKTCIQGLRFNKTNDFYCFIKDILKWTGIFLNWGRGSEKQWLLLPFAALPLLYQSGTCTFTHCCFCIIHVNVNIMKKTSNISLLLWMQFWPCWPPERILGTLRFLWTTLWNHCSGQMGLLFCKFIHECLLSPRT